MSSTEQSDDGLARLIAVRDRVRALARERPRFAGAIGAAFADYVRIRRAFLDEETAALLKKWELAREVLARGQLSDPDVDHSRCFVVPFQGLCPAAVAERLSQHRRGAIPADLERKGAAAGLAAIDAVIECNTRELTREDKAAIEVRSRAAIEVGTHVSFGWEIFVSRPGDWREPVNPGDMSRENLARLSEVDYRTVCFHRLGGLADVGAIRPIVPKPEAMADRLRDRELHRVWDSRLPISDSDWELDNPPLSTDAFDPDLAEQMLADVEAWLRDRGVADSGAGDRAAGVSGDKSDGTTPSRSAGAEALEEADAALLTFLNLAPGRRYKVADVLPDKGPQDRKAVAVRLRGLAERTPALVDFPKKARKGVAILPAGVEALKRATPPTPP